jgi:hypothetical protein
MPKGPRGEKRPGDPVANAIRVGRIAVGDEPDVPVKEKDPAGVSLGKRGGAARAKALSPKKRKEIAKKAAAKRWDK